MLAVIDEPNCIGCTKVYRLSGGCHRWGDPRHAYRDERPVHRLQVRRPCPTQCISLVPVATTGDLKWDLHTIPVRNFLWNNMFKLFSAFRKDKVWDFNGGIHPPEMKTQSRHPAASGFLPQRCPVEAARRRGRTVR